MPVHNALPFLDAAIESILSQTWRDFEFVILDDASTDGSRERLRQWKSQDARIRLIEAKENLGPAMSSQRVAKAASAPFVARMDADDLSYPTRLESQVGLLLENPDVGIVGCLADVIDSNGARIRGPERWRLARKSLMVPFAHDAILYRRELFDNVGGYRRECEYWEDQDLILRMGAVSKVLVIPRAMCAIRQSPTSIRAASDQEKIEDSVSRMYDCIARLRAAPAYDELLRSEPGSASKIDPRVFISLGSVSLWAGGRPRLFRRLLSRGKLRVNFATVSAIVWTSWASASPSTLRAFLRTLLNVRNRIAAVPTDVPVRWEPPLPNRSGRKAASA